MNNYDSTLFPTSEYLLKSPYNELFQDLRANKGGNRFFKINYIDTAFGISKGVILKQKERRTFLKWGNMPIGGISQLQAESYCKWLQNNYNMLLVKYNKPCSIEIRLPNSNELNRAMLAKGVLPQSGVSWQTYRFVAILHEQPNNK